MYFIFQFAQKRNLILIYLYPSLSFGSIHSIISQIIRFVMKCRLREWDKMICISSKTKKLKSKKQWNCNCTLKYVETSCVYICTWYTFTTCYCVKFKFNILDLIECNILGRNCEVCIISFFGCDLQIVYIYPIYLMSLGKMKKNYIELFLFGSVYICT